MSAFRFSCNFFGVSSGDAFVDKCRRAEECGYDAVLAPDHLGAPAPFPLLVAAAAATERLRVGTLVLNVPFWNPALLAREVATTDILTGGRLEVGLGAGHMKWEFDEAGIGWKPFSTRADQLATTITELERYFTTDFESLPEGAAPCPVQRCDATCGDTAGQQRLMAWLPVAGSGWQHYEQPAPPWRPNGNTHRKVLKTGSLHQQLGAQSHSTAPTPSTKRPITARSRYTDAVPTRNRLMCRA